MTSLGCPQCVQMQCVCHSKRTVRELGTTAALGPEGYSEQLSNLSLLISPFKNITKK